MSRWWNTRRFDWLEFSLMGVLMATAATVVAVSVMEYAGLSYVTYSAAREGARLKDRYGSTRFSEHVEEWVIRDYFHDRRDGFFVDVGANHYRNYNNTFYLDSVLGWSGVAIDPQTTFAADYRAHRPRTRYFSFFVSDTSDANVTLYQVHENSLVASADRRFAERAGTDAADPLHATAAVTCAATPSKAGRIVTTVTKVARTTRRRRRIQRTADVHPTSGRSPSAAASTLRAPST